MKPSDLRSAYLDCRDVGHGWRLVTVGTRGQVVPRELLCFRCDTEKTEEVHRKTGEVVGRQYRYAKGYLLPRNSGKYVRRHFRQVAVERAIKKMLSRRKK